MDFLLPGVDNKTPVLSSVQPAALSLNCKSTAVTSSANASKELTLQIISVSNTSPTLEAPFSLCLQNNPYMKKDDSTGIGPTIPESNLICTCVLPEEMKYLT